MTYDAWKTTDPRDSEVECGEPGCERLVTSTRDEGYCRRCADERRATERGDI